MRISVTEAKGQLTELVRRAEAGDVIVLTRHDKPAARPVPAKGPIDRQARRRLLDDVQATAAAKATVGEPAARSQDFLYGDDGLAR